jgi:hypothetical protein
VLDMTDVTDVLSVVVAGAAAAFAALAWYSGDKARNAAEREASAAEQANKTANEANEIAREAAQESRAAYQLQVAQHLHQSAPKFSMTVGPVPRYPAGLLSIEIWSDVAFDAGTITLPREFIPALFAGFPPILDEPERYECASSIELPATEAASSVRCYLWVPYPEDLPGASFRLLCQLRIADQPPWQYVLSCTFPH